MAKVIVQPGHDVRALADHAGSAVKGQIGFRPSNSELEVGDVTQPALDAALITYIADQANIDADFADKLKDEEDDRVKDEFDDDSIVTAIVKEMVDQLNAIRANAGMPALNFGTVNAAIRSRIGQP